MTNNKKLWFKRKSYGWGWTPCSWQGWVVLAGYVAILLLVSFTLDEHAHIDNNTPLPFLLFVFSLTTLLIIICYKKGEKPAWQWGVHKENK